MLPFEEGEYKVFVAHKHWFIFAIRLISMIIAAVFPLIILPFLDFLPGVELGLLIDLFTFAYCLYLMLVLIITFVLWTDYYLDMAVVTNRRIMDVEQKGLFSRVVSTLRYEAIQDVTTDIVGVIPTLLNYGDLYVQTAAEKREFCIDSVADPITVKAVISRELTKVREGHL